MTVPPFRVGHIKLSRKMFDGSDDLWSEPREFSRAEAWIDLIQRAAWRDTPYVTGYAVDTLHRGEFIGSLRFFGERWQWGKDRVAKFFALLENLGRLSRQRQGQHGAVYLLVNYDTYNAAADSTGTPEQTPAQTQDRQTADTEQTKKKAVKQLSSKEQQLLGASGDAPSADMGETRSPSPTPVSAASPPRERSQEGAAARRGRHEYPAEFEAAWAAYPSRGGAPNSKWEACKRWGARRREGVAAEAMRAGVERYAAWCRATGKTGTELVMQGTRFFGPSREWESTFAVSAAPRDHAAEVWALLKPILHLPREPFHAALAAMEAQGAIRDRAAFLADLKRLDFVALRGMQKDEWAIQHIRQRLGGERAA